MGRAFPKANCGKNMKSQSLGEDGINDRTQIAMQTTSARMTASPCCEWHVQGIQGTMVKSWAVMAVLRKVDITKPKKAKLVKKRKDLAAQFGIPFGLQISQKTFDYLSEVMRVVQPQFASRQGNLHLALYLQQQATNIVPVTISQLASTWHFTATSCYLRPQVCGHVKSHQ